MRTLIEDLLAYSRAGRSEREPEPVDLTTVVAEVAATLCAPRSRRPRSSGRRCRSCTATPSSSASSSRT